MDAPHPVAAWMAKNGVDEEKLVALLQKKAARKASPDYLAEVVSGYYPPSRKLALALEKVTGINAGSILTFTYRAPRAV